MCLLLWGLHEVRFGITRAFGGGLRQVIAAGTKNRVLAFLSGIGVTAVVQSSTATALILSSFCAQGLIGTAMGIAVMLGADVGTTLVAQVLSFDLSFLAPLLLISGFVLFSGFEKRNGRLSHVGKVLAGLGLMMLALGWIKSTAVPLKDSEILVLILESLENDPVMAIGIMAILTWLAHSSLASVLLLVSFVVSGILPVHVGMMMVLGANLGAVAAPIVATIKDDVLARRVPLGNLMIRLTGVILTYPLMDTMYKWLVMVDDDPARILVNFHTLFNVMLALTFLPLTGLVARFCARILPEGDKSADEGYPRYLDDRAIDTPAVALSATTRETLRLADMVEAMLEEMMLAMRDNDERLVTKVRERDDVVDRLHRAIKMYMAKISQEAMAPDEATRYLQILTFSTNLENVGDMIDKGLIPMAIKKVRDHKRFSDQGWREIRDVHKFVVETVRLAQNVFVSEDVNLARRLVERKDELRLKEAWLTTTHLGRIREGVPETIATSSLHLDIIRDYRRINNYMCTVAYPILEQRGLLRETRLIATDK
ncbi:MAG: Na/Pi cotransporter family protein [Rhodospirillales bacterium]|nr:Na/Pi cotransporter family protein [Rhodospirillales bacterium]